MPTTWKFKTIGHDACALGLKNNGGSWFGVAHNTDSGHSQNPVNAGIKQHGSGPQWFDVGICKHSSRSYSRKAASALIAKIPFALAQHIARVFKTPNFGNYIHEYS